MTSILNGIGGAEVADGPHQGWPLVASLAMSRGVAPHQARAAVIAELEQERARIDAAIARIQALPEPPPLDSAVIVGAGALAISSFMRERQ